MQLVKENNLLKQEESMKICTKEIGSVEEGKILYNALEKCDILLSEMVGKTIKIKDLYIEKKDVLDDEKGEVKSKYRTIIFDTDGKTYATGSYGIYNSLVKMCTIFGAPTWEEGIEVLVDKRKISDNKYSLTLMIK